MTRLTWSEIPDERRRQVLGVLREQAGHRRWSGPESGSTCEALLDAYREAAEAFEAAIAVLEARGR